MRTGALIVGRYRVLRQIGSGGMGAVWLARDESLGRDVALKRAHPAAEEGRLRRLAREARIAGGIDHPRVVTLYDLVKADAATWLVMEYVPSRDLAEIIADGVLPPRDVARIGGQLADALAAVHAKGVVHGDVKPGNVLVTETGDAKLTDFGVARAIWGDETVSDSGLFRGTPAYVAPEVARGATPLPAADVFSLGATLFAALEGVSPLGSGDNPLSVVWRSAAGHVAAPRAEGALGTALSAMLRIEPDERPDAAEVRRMLDAYADPDASTNAEAGPPPARRRFARARVAVGAAAVLLVAAGAGGLFLSRPAGSSSRSGGGTATPTTSATPATPQPTAAVAAIGDERTADPCGLMDPAGLRRFGRAKLSTDYGNFDRCDVLLQHGDADLADVEVQLDEGPAPEPGSRDRVERHGRVAVISEPLDGDQCDRTLTLTDGRLVAVTAKRAGPGAIDLCAAATVAADHAADLLARSAVPRRAGPFPPASLARQDACALLTPAELSAAQVDTGHPDVGFGRWNCRWHARTGGTGVQLRFDRNGPLGADAGTPARLGGHAAYVQPDGDGSGTCLAQVVHRTYRSTGGGTTAEIVFLVVSGSQRSARLCALAKSLASAAATRLPTV